ncbi:TonB-dependent receptor [Sphingomonas sp. ac-8]|uniref:TonB-dependent receptor n=1 Tax=Sphingomonas sp. ac-8 TaxID=3242977 RepID=UPI003A812B01
MISRWHRSRSVQAEALRMGASALALAAVGAALPAWARVQPQDTPDAAQQAAGPDLEAAGDGEIVVTGRRAALEAADDRKRRSETIVDSVVADDAGKLPDNSITEVLQRVSGVSIVRFSALNDPDHFSAQGSGVQVRGLSGVASRLNGREIFSANGGRALLWGDVTPELMSAVDVYKASTADLIEGGTGGQIDLRTRLPFDYRDQDVHIAATGELSLGDLAQNADYAGSILVSKNFETGIGDIGVMVDVARSRFTQLSQFFRVEPYFRTRLEGDDYYVPGGYAYGDERFQRDRTGIYGAVQWAPSDAFTLTGTFFQSRYENLSSDYGAQVASQVLAVNPSESQFDENGLLVSSPSVFVRDQNTFLPSGGSIVSGGNKGVWDSETVTRDYSLAAQFTPADSPLSIKGAIQRVESTNVLNRLDVFRDLNFPTSFGFDLTGDLPVVSVPTGSQAIFDNPANYLWSASMPHNENNKGRLDSANLDLEYSFDDSFFRSVKVGGRWSERTERDYNNGYNWAALGRGWNGDPQLTFANAAPGDIERHTFKNFFRGDAVIPGELLFPSYDLVSRLDREQLTQSPPAGFCSEAQQYDCSASGPLPTTGYGGGSGIRQIGFIEPDDRTDYRTQTWAGYALVRFGREGGQFSGNVGARLVHIDNTSSGFFQQNSVQFINSDGETVTLAQQSGVRSAGAKFTRVLPSVNVEYALSDSFKLRGGYNITLDNQSFTALRSSGTLGVATSTNPVAGQPGIFTNFTLESGDPTLKPTTAHNFDLSLEYYGRAGSSFHIAPFYKRLLDTAIFSLTQQPITATFTDGTTFESLGAATIYANSPEAAEIKGVEVGGRYFFDMLPGWLSGIGVEANYTFIDSKNPGDVYRDINGAIHTDAPLVGLSKHNVNATFLYEKDPFSLRIAYTWRSKYLQSTNASGTNPTYSYYTAPGVVYNPTTGEAVGTQIALPTYSDSYGQLDAGIRFKVNDNFSFGIQAQNLTNSTQRVLMGGYPGGKLVGRSWFQSDRRIATSISLVF